MIPEEQLTAPPAAPEPGSLAWRTEMAKQNADLPPIASYEAKVAADAATAKQEILDRRARLGLEMPPVPGPPNDPYPKYEPNYSMGAGDRSTMMGGPPPAIGEPDPYLAPMSGVDAEAPMGRDAKGKAYSLPPGKVPTPEQQQERQQWAEMKREETRSARSSAELKSLDEAEQRRQTVLNRQEEKRARYESEAATARAWNNKIRARRGLPPLPEPGTAPAGASTGVGGPQTPPMGSRAPAGPSVAPAVSARAPVSAPSVSSVGQMPPMQTVRTLDGDFRRQSINGSDNAVPLVELTGQGRFVPNPNGLDLDQFTSAYTPQDALAVTEMIRQSGDPSAAQAQQRLDASRRAIMGSTRLTSQERADALSELNSRQTQLHYGFLQSQGIGSGVRAGFGDMSPQAPLMESVYQMMDTLRKRYPNATESQLYQLATQMAAQSGTRSQPTGTVPFDVQLSEQLSTQERGFEQQAQNEQQAKQVQQIALDMQNKGMEPQDATEFAKAVATGDTQSAQQIIVRSSENKMLRSVRDRWAPVTETDIETQIMSQVIGQDAEYQSKARRLITMANAMNGDKKAQDDLQIYPGSEEWEQTFGPDGSYKKMQDEVRKTVQTALTDEKNRRKATAQVREKRNAKQLFDVNDPETQMAVVDLVNRYGSTQEMEADKENIKSVLGISGPAYTLAMAISMGREGQRGQLPRSRYRELMAAADAMRDRLSRHGIKLNLSNIVEAPAASSK